MWTTANKNNKVTPAEDEVSVLRNSVYHILYSLPDIYRKKKLSQSQANFSAVPAIE